jgi:hypothetical protein
MINRVIINKDGNVSTSRRTKWTARLLERLISLELDANECKSAMGDRNRSYPAIIVGLS